jgi:DNA polymerase I
MAAKALTYEDFPAEELYRYAGIDCIVTSDLLKKLWPVVTQKPAYQLSTAGVIEQSFAPSILQEAREVKQMALSFMVDMECNGIVYDVQGNRNMASLMRAQIRELEDELYCTLRTTPSMLNLNSDAHLSKLLYETHGFTTAIKTKTGALSTSGDALQEIFEATGTPWVKQLVQRNDLNTLHNSFLATYVEDWVKADGRIHPNYNLNGTSSHRISCDNPNLLNLPRPSDIQNIRKLYTVCAGHVFVTFDFSSCEVKILAALCRDVNMLQAIADGLDFHSYTASKISGIPYDEFVAVLDSNDPSLKKQKSLYKQVRQAAKAITFGILYGSTAYAIALKLGKTLKEVEDLIALYFQTFPRILTFINDCHAMAKLNHMVFTPFGQRKMEYGTYDCFKYTAVYNAALRNSQNVRIQSPASTLGLAAFSQLNSINKPLGALSLATVYDSVEISSPLHAVAQVIENGFYCMDDWPKEAYDWLDFSIGADAEVGFNWGELVHVYRGETQEQIAGKLRNLDPVKFAQCVAADV